MRLAVTCLVLLPAVAHSAPPVAYRGAGIHTAAGPVMANGTLVVRDGKIVAVGPADRVEVPEGARVVDLSGKTVIPGLVDTHSHLGVWVRPGVPAHSDGNEGSGPVQSALRALDALYPDDPGFRMALAGGVTTANVMPGSGNVIGGQTVYVKLRGRTVAEMRLTPGKVLGGLKMANGENPKRLNFERNKRAPATRMKLAALQREQFVKARDYQRKWQAYEKAKAEGKDVPPPDRDLALEPLVEVLEGKRTVHFHCHRADDLMSAVRLAEEFGFELVLQHATEGHRVAEELARRKIGCSLTLVDSPGGKPEAAGLMEENAAVLQKAGVKVAINTDDAITESRFFLRTGSLAVRGGMTEEEALEALTINPAEMLHLEGRIGSLEAGKDADFVVLSGPPFSVYTQVLQTYIEGEVRFDRSRHRDWAYQAGGFALPDLGRLPKAPPPLDPLPEEEAPARPEGSAKPAESAPTLAVLAGRIHTVGKGTITDGAILVEKGKVTAVGPRKDVNIPPGTPVLTAAVVTPGLIDAHSVVGVAGAFNLPADQDQDELTETNQADLRVLDGFNPNEPLLEYLRQQGVTVVHATPGRTNVLAGQTGVFRTHGVTAEGMLIGKFPFGLLVNLGEIPKAAYPGKAPTTRMGTAGIVRKAFVDAQSDARKRAATKEPDKLPPRDLKLEALQAALEGKARVIFSAHRADDVDTALRLREEFKLQACIDLATEGYLMADRLAAAKVPVVVHPTMQRAAGSMETHHSHLCNAAVLAEHKVPVAIGSGYESYVPKTRVVRFEAAMAMVNGLGHEGALRAVTLDAAKVLGIDGEFGSIEPGKAADLVLYDGDCFEHTTHVTYTVIGGRVVYDREEYLKVPFARRALPLTAGGGVECCLGLW